MPANDSISEGYHEAEPWKTQQPDDSAPRDEVSYLPSQPALSKLLLHCHGNMDIDNNYCVYIALYFLGVVFDIVDLLFSVFSPSLDFSRFVIEHGGQFQGL